MRVWFTVVLEIFGVKVFDEKIILFHPCDQEMLVY